MATSLPSCLVLTLSLAAPQKARKRTNKQRHVACTAPHALSGGALVAPAQLPKTLTGVEGHDASTSWLVHFDTALAAGRLDTALAELRAAAVAADGAAPPLLEPARNRAFIQACFNLGQPRKAVEYLELLHPSAAPWAAVMREANKRRDLATVQRVLAARQSAGWGLNAHVATAAISGYSTSGRLHDALAIFCRAWEQRECRSVWVINAAISACADQANWAAAQEVLAIMEKEGIQPDIVTYNCLLKAAAAGSGLLPEALRLYGDMRAAGLQPTTYTYSALFTAAAKAQHGDAEWLLQTFDEMVAAHVEPNNHVVSALFTAASYAACSPTQLDRLFAVLALLRSYGPPNDQVYTALLTLAQRQAIQERAADVWTAVKQDGVQQSPHLFSSLFAACASGAGASPALVDAALEAAEAMQAVWRAACSRGRPRPQYERDMLVAYNALLHFLGCTQELQRSLAIYALMRRAGPSPDVVTFNTLIATAAAAGRVQVAMAIFSDMVDSDAEPTEQTVGALLHCYAKARDAASAQRVFQGMRQLGIQPNLRIYTSLIDACVQAGSKQWLRLAFELFEEMRREGLQPSAVTYGCLLVACERMGDVDRAFQLYQQACDEGVVPSDRMHDMLICMCTSADRLEEAVNLVKRLARAPSASHSPQGSSGSSTGASSGSLVSGGGGGSSSGALALQEGTLNSLIRALCAKYIDRALRLLSLCQTMGMRTSRRTYLALVAGCARASRSDAAYHLYRSLRAQGMESDSTSGSLLIVSLCKANQLEMAETVYNDMLACAWRREHASLPAPMARRSGLSNRASLPDNDALAALVQAFAVIGDLRTAAKYYKQLRRAGPRGLAAAALTQRRMWEVLIENYCRQHDVKHALAVFDDWKAARDDWIAAQQQHAPNNDRLAASAAAARSNAGLSTPSKTRCSGRTMTSSSDKGVDARPAAVSAQAPARSYPKLSAVSLAFLEACCRSEPDYEWRVYDVCAVMRQQKELKRQAGLARPQKQSHHFAPA